MKKTKKRLALDAHTIKPLVPTTADDALQDVVGGKAEAARCSGVRSGCVGGITEQP